MYQLRMFMSDVTLSGSVIRTYDTGHVILGSIGRLNSIGTQSDSGFICLY